MSDVIDFNTKTPLKVPTKENVPLLKFIEDALKKGETIESLMLGVKYEDGDMEFMRTENFDIKDRAFLLQLLQSDIQEELAPTMFLELEPDL